MTPHNITAWKHCYIDVLKLGCFSRVYNLPDDKIAKVLKTMWPYFFEQKYEPLLKSLVEERDIHQELFKAGIHVPKPEGIFTIGLESVVMDNDTVVSDYGTVLKRTPILVPVIVSQRVYGEESALDMYPSAREQYEEQIAKAAKEGLYPSDMQPDREGNTIFDPEQKKLWLIDFGLWTRR